MRALVMIKVNISEKQLRSIEQLIREFEAIDEQKYEIQDFITLELEEALSDSFDTVSVETIELERPSWN